MTAGPTLAGELIVVVVSAGNVAGQDDHCPEKLKRFYSLNVDGRLMA